MRKRTQHPPKKIPKLILMTVICWSIASTAYNIFLFNTWYPGQPVKVAFIVTFFVANIVIQVLSRLDIVIVDRAYTRSACAIEKLIQLAAMVAEYLNDDGRMLQIHSVKYSPIIAVLFFTIIMNGCDRIFALLLQQYKRKKVRTSKPASQTRRSTRIPRIRGTVRRPHRGKQRKNNYFKLIVQKFLGRRA